MNKPLCSLPPGAWPTLRAREHLEVFNLDAMYRALLAHAAADEFTTNHEASR